MGKLIYGTNVSLDGFIEDAQGRFDFSEPSDEVHAFINDLYRPVGTHLYGRRLYETMSVWETDPSLAESEVGADWAGIWADAEKIVYSTALKTPVTSRTRIERSFDPAAVRSLKASAERNLIIGGAELAAHAWRAGLVDELQLFVSPIAIGAGKPALPDDIRIHLDLIEERRFANGTVFLHYAVKA